MKPHHKSFYLLLVFIVVVHAFFLGYALNKNQFYIHPDSQEYLQQRNNILNHGSIYQGDMNQPHRWYLETRRPPLTGIILAAVRLLSSSDILILIVQNVLSVLVIATSIRIALSFNPDIHPAWFVLPVCFFPTQMIYCNFVMAEVFFQSLLFAGFYFLLKPFSKNSILVFFLFAILACFVKPVLYLLWVPLGMAMLVLSKKAGLRPADFAGAAVMLSAVLLFSFYNFQRTGVFAFSSAAESFLPDYVVLPAVHLADGKEAAVAINEQIHASAQQAGSYAGYHKTLISESLDALSHYPASVFFIWTKGMIQFLVDPGRWDLAVFFSKKPEEHPDGLVHKIKNSGWAGVQEFLKTKNLFELTYSLFAAVVNLFIVISFVVFLKDSRYPLLFRVFACMTVLYLVVLTGPVGSARYRMAVFPLLLISWAAGVRLIKFLFKAA